MRIHADPDPQPWFVLCGNLLNSYHMELLGQSPSPRLKLGLGGSSWPGWWMGEENRLGNRELVSSLPATDNPRLFFISADTGYECWISGNQPHSQHWPENLYLPVLEHVFFTGTRNVKYPGYAAFGHAKLGFSEYPAGRISDKSVSTIRCTSA